MANLAGYIYCSRPERWYTPLGDPLTWPATVHVHAAYNDGSTSYLGPATYTASYEDYRGIGNGYWPNPDVPSDPGYYDLSPEVLRHVALPPEQQRTFLFDSVEAGSSLLASGPDYLDISEVAASIDPDTWYLLWLYWEAPLDEWGALPRPARAAFVVPVSNALWQGMPVNEDWHRFVAASDAGGTPLAFWTDRVGVQEVI